MKRCTVLMLDAADDDSPHLAGLRQAGFVVHAAPDLPHEDGGLRAYHAVVVRVRDVATAPMMAARLRAKPHFGRRILIALVDPATPKEARRIALASGFDDVLNVCSESRQLTGRILRGLRARPELRCSLPPPAPRRAAA